jgi:ABC-type phosphate transport system substrate-binding protein
VGSSFAAPAIETWTRDVSQAPYSLSLNYSSTNSGDGRYQFTNQTTDFAASDIGYVGSTDTAKPSFPFIFVPITAGGIAFMYNVPGLTKTLQLSSYTACGILTGGITNWDDPAIAADNGGVAGPNLHIAPVTENDSAGTNYVLEEWCIDEQPTLWSAFAHAQEVQPGGPTDGVAISPTSPNSNWPGVAGGFDVTNTTTVAGDVAANPGAIGAVQEQYAVDEQGFNSGNPAKAVAAVKNASGDYTQPNAVDVASALAYATQQADGTHQLNFNGVGPHVYNPSTYSYLLTPTTGWQSSKGAVLSGFANYVLTLGQAEAPKFGYASLGLSLEQFGINSIKADVPGAVGTTAAEAAGYSCGDLTPTEVAAGQTTPTCGVTNGGTLTVAGANAGHAVGAASTAAGKSGAAGRATGGSSGVGGSSSGVDPAVSLGGNSPLAFTGGDPIPLVIVGLGLMICGWVARRRLLRLRSAKRQ